MRKSKRKSLVSIVILVALCAGLFSYTLPFIKIRLSGLGVLQYSFADLVDVLPKPQFGSKTKIKAPEIDFMEVLEKISSLKDKSILPSPKKKGSFKIAPEIVLGGLIPIALGFSYFLALLSILLTIVGNKALVGKFLFFSILTSGYVIGGGYYLSRFVQHTIAESGKGVLGALTGALSKSVGVQTEFGAYLLFGSLLLAFCCHAMKRA